METVLMYVLFIIGLVIIIKGGAWFVDSASWIADPAGLPKIVIGATIVSIATTLPEIVVSATATAKGNVDMAAGNAIGSVTANTAMILGLFILCVPFSVKRRDFAPKSIMLLCAEAAVFLGCIFSAKEILTFEGETSPYYRLSTIAAVILLVILIVFFVENFMSMKKENVIVEPAPDNIGLQPEDGITTSKETATKKDWAKKIIIFIIGAAATVIGAQLLVDEGTKIAESLHVPQRLISIIAISIGTSLPELVTTITAIRKKVGSISVGNILGANILDLTLVLPLCTFISLGKGTGQLPVTSSLILIDLLVCLAASVIAIVPTIITKKFHRWQGFLSLAGYIVYVVYIAIAQ